MKKLIITAILIAQTQASFAYYDYGKFSLPTPMPVRRTIVTRHIATDIKPKDANTVTMVVKNVKTECEHDAGYFLKNQHDPKQITNLIYIENENGEVANFKIPNPEKQNKEKL